MGYNAVAHNSKYVSIFIRLALPLNLRNPAKFSEITNILQFKVIQGHRSWCGAREPWRQSRRGSHKISPNGAKIGLGSHKFSEVID